MRMRMERSPSPSSSLLFGPATIVTQWAARSVSASPTERGAVLARGLYEYEVNMSALLDRSEAGDRRAMAQDWEK